MTYLITFSCYGSHLHWSESGSVDREHNMPGSPVLNADILRHAVARRCMDQEPYLLDEIRREAVLKSINNVCAYRAWHLLAVHVRSTHVHVVVEAETAPELVMNTFKSYASRGLNEMGVDEVGRRRWTRHGSTRWLRRPEQVSAALQYVISEQGEPMALFEA